MSTDAMKDSSAAFGSGSFGSTPIHEPLWLTRPKIGVGANRAFGKPRNVLYDTKEIFGKSGNGLRH